MKRLASTLCIGLLIVGFGTVSGEQAHGAVLLGYWKMEENQPTQKAVDSSAKGLLGTYNTGVDPNVYGAPGFDLGTDFRNTTSTITINDSAYVLSNLTQDFSVMAWINLESVGTTQRILSNNTWGFGIGNEKTIRLTTYGIKDYKATTDLSSMLGTWIHVAAVMDSNNAVTFYLNGVSDGTFTHTAPGTASNSLSYIGGRSATGSGEHFNGLVDEVAVFSGVLTQQEIQNYMRYGIPVPKHPVFRYDYNSSETLPTIPDDSGQGHPATGSAAVYAENTPRAGFPTPLLPGGMPKGTGDRSLDTSNGGIVTTATNLVNNSLIAQAGGFTMETWVYRLRDTNASGLEKIIDIAGCYRLQLTPTTDVVSFTLANGSATLPVGEWHHLAAVFDTLGNQMAANGDLAGVARFYFDGMQLGTDTATTLSGSNDTSYLQTRGIGLGRHPSNSGELFQGLLYDSRMVLGVLSPGEFLLKVPEPSSLLLGSWGLLVVVTLGSRARWRRQVRSKT